MTRSQWAALNTKMLPRRSKPKKPKRTWARAGPSIWQVGLPGANALTVVAHTASEARAEAKKLYGINKRKGLPAGWRAVRLAPTEASATPNPVPNPVVAWKHREISPIQASAPKKRLWLMPLELIRKSLRKAS